MKQRSESGGDHEHGSVEIVKLDDAGEREAPFSTIDNDDEDDINKVKDEEFQGLLGWPMPVPLSKRNPNIYIIRIAFVLLLLSIAVWVFAATVSHFFGMPAVVDKGYQKSNNSELDHQEDGGIVVDYKCPNTDIDSAKNDKDGSFEAYTSDVLSHQASNLTLDDLMNMKYDAWGMTPRQHKVIAGRWVHWYADAISKQRQQEQYKLQANHVHRNRSTNTNYGVFPRSTIYESACGVGLSLYGMLELLQERYNITGLEVYGNDYISDSVVAANRLYEKVLPNSSGATKVDAHLGKICHADSANLSFVPSNSFDIVMTGYIDPIVDRLNLNWTSKEYDNYCHSDKEEYKNLMRQEQGIQEDWHASWAGEMIRIAKPGATIVVETGGRSRCRDGGWGGVDTHWWAQAISKYKWDVDATTMEWMDFDPEQRHEGLRNRYNVKFKKLK